MWSQMYIFLFSNTIRKMLMKRNSFVMFCIRSTAHQCCRHSISRCRRRRRRQDSREFLTIGGARYVHNNIIYLIYYYIVWLYEFRQNYWDSIVYSIHLSIHVYTTKLYVGNSRREENDNEFIIIIVA